MADPKENWGPGRRSLAYTVELEGAEVRLTRPSSGGRRTTVYVVDRVEVTTRWLIGQEEGGQTVMKLDCREIIGGRPSWRSGVLYPDDLDGVPPWLTDIETRASPRDVG